MGYLTAKKFSEKWEISERRIIKLCSENRISGAVKDGMVWLIPEDTIKPSDKRSNIYKYINIPKKILIVNIKEEIKEFLINLLNKQGYIAECKDFDSIGELSKYYEGLIFFTNKNMDRKEEKFIEEFSLKLNSESSIIIVDYTSKKRNKVEEKLASKLENDIGIKINTLLLDFENNENTLIDYEEIANDIFDLLVHFKNTTGTAIKTNGGKIEFDNNGKSKNLETGKFYKAINNYFKKLTKESYLWCASTMLEDEWTEEPLEMNFRIINLEAANRGTKIDRIFIFSKNKIKEFKNNKTLKIYMQSNINTMWVDYDEILENKPELLEILGEGWDGIDKNTLIVDLPSSSKQRGYITKNTEEVLKAYNCFQELKKYSKSLKEVLK